MPCLNLKSDPNLKDFQIYVEKMVGERGFKNEISQDLVLFVEEVGELARAIRNQAGLKVALDSNPAREIADELADCFIYILNLANRYEVDLEQAFRKKEEKNNTRIWT